MEHQEQDSRALEVLARSLNSESRETRRRAVSMLSRVDCPSRERWLADACDDPDELVATTALCVMSWVADATGPPWPQREDIGSEFASDGSMEPWPAAGVLMRWRWEYIVEVWRDDGLLVGTYLAATCAEDDEHARRVALGQAILANAGGQGDAFEPATAAAFIVAKRCLSDLPGSGPPADR